MSVKGAVFWALGNSISWALGKFSFFLPVKG